MFAGARRDGLNISETVDLLRTYISAFYKNGERNASQNTSNLAADGLQQQKTTSSSMSCQPRTKNIVINIDTPKLAVQI